jgi:hypothetical protein
VEREGHEAVERQLNEDVGMNKKAWQTPSLEMFGTMHEKTQEGDPNAKLEGSFDGDPFEDCPPGQFPCNGAGGVS